MMAESAPFNLRDAGFSAWLNRFGCWAPCAADQIPLWQDWTEEEVRGRLRYVATGAPLSAEDAEAWVLLVRYSRRKLAYLWSRYVAGSLPGNLLERVSDWGAA